MMSASLHAIVIALFLVTGYLTSRNNQEAPAILEMVAGEGDNYMATEAPALGSPTAIKLDIPELPVAPPQRTPAPVQAAPEPVIERAPPKAEPKAEPKVEQIPDLSKLVKQKAAITQIRAEANEKLRRERAEKKAREEAAKKAKEEAAKKAKEDAAKSSRMTKEEFDRLNKSKTTPAPKAGSSPIKVAKIDTKGITSGVIGGSTANTKGGAGGTALTRAETDAVDAYVSLLATKIKNELDERPGVLPGLVVEVEIRIRSDGSITGFRILRSSGSADFDQAVREGMANIRMPPRPKGLSELQRFPIRGSD